jgi:hypothetical protein
MECTARFDYIAKFTWVGREAILTGMADVSKPKKRL